MGKVTISTEDCAGLAYYCECGKVVLEGAIECPHCGEEIAWDIWC